MWMKRDFLFLRCKWLVSRSKDRLENLRVFWRSCLRKLEEEGSKQVKMMSYTCSDWMGTMRENDRDGFPNPFRKIV